MNSKVRSWHPFGRRRWATCRVDGSERTFLSLSCFFLMFIFVRSTSRQIIQFQLLQSQLYIYIILFHGREAERIKTCQRIKTRAIYKTRAILIYKKQGNRLTRRPCKGDEFEILIFEAKRQNAGICRSRQKMFATWTFISIGRRVTQE